MQTMDVLLFSMEAHQLRNTAQLSLYDLFPVLQRFGPNICYCSASKRVAVASLNGGLALFYLQRQTRIQTVTAHSGRIAALAFSPDAGRLLASYSHCDNRLVLWQVRFSHNSFLNLLIHSYA